MWWKRALTVGCVYEVVALWVPPVPTITSLVHLAKDHRLLRYAVWLAAGASVWHFYVEGEL